MGFIWIEELKRSFIFKLSDCAKIEKKTTLERKANICRRSEASSCVLGLLYVPRWILNTSFWRSCFELLQSIVRYKVQWKNVFFSKWNWTCHANMAGKCGVTIPSSTLRVVELRTPSKARGRSKSFYSMVHLRKSLKKLFRKPILPPLQYGRKVYQSVRGEIHVETWFWRHASR